MEPSTRRVVLVFAQIGVVLLAVAVLAVAGLIMLLAQLSHNREESVIWTIGAAVIGLISLGGLAWLFIYLNRKRRNTGVIAAPFLETVHPVTDERLQRTLQLLRVALIAILLVGIGGLALRFSSGRPPVRLLVISLVMLGIYVAPYGFALLRIYDRFDGMGVALAHAFAWASLLMSFRFFGLFLRNTVEFRQVLVISVVNLLLDAVVIYCGIRLWRAVRQELFFALLVGALIYRVTADFMVPLFYSRVAF